jgi:hypothetical protein
MKKLMLIGAAVAVLGAQPALVWADTPHDAVAHAKAEASAAKKAASHAKHASHKARHHAKAAVSHSAKAEEHAIDQAH